MQISIKQKRLGVPVGETLLGKTVSIDLYVFFLHPHLIFFLVTSLKNSMNIWQIDFLFLGLMFM